MAWVVGECGCGGGGGGGGFLNIVLNKSESFLILHARTFTAPLPQHEPARDFGDRSTPRDTSVFIVRYYCGHYIILFFDRVQFHYSGLRLTGQREEPAFY